MLPQKDGPAFVLKKQAFSAIIRGIPTIRSISGILQRNWQVVFFSLFILAFAVSLGGIFFLRARMQMEEQLKESLRLGVSMAARQFDGEGVESIRDRESMESPVFRDIVRRLRTLRTDAPDIRFAYILRRTEDPTTLEFVADADSLATDAELDANGDGTVDPDEMVASYPGDPYDLLQAPAMAYAFSAPTTDDSIVRDPWGSTMSGYAPIRNDAGDTVAILGIDMDADQFVALTQRVFSPVAFLIFCITVTLLVVYIIVFLWQRKMEALERIDQERSGVMLLTFHQLGTPLTICSWSLETLLEAMRNKEPLEPAVQEHARSMQVAMAQVRGILETMKQASLIDTGKMAYHPEDTSLRAVCESVISAMCDGFANQCQEVKLEIDPALRLSIDPSLIGGAIREVLQNAMFYSPRTSVVEISARRHGDTVRLQVVDHGCGIAAAELPRLFGKYTRGVNASRYHPDGNGMGLFVARGIMRRAGGDLTIESTENVGTKVIFTLPVKAAA